LTGSDDKTARLWDVATGQPKGPPLRHDGTVWAVAFSPDGRTALTGSWDKTARLWDVATREPIGLPLEHRGPVFSVSYSPDGLMVLTGSRDGTAQLWMAASQRPIGAPFLHQGPVKAAAFSPDGRWIATGSDDRTVQFWRTPTPIEGSPDRLSLWVRVITLKEMSESGAIRSLDLDSWKKLRDELARLGGPPDQPAGSGTAVSSPR
jgi:WD40 repeat protein